MLAFLLVGCTLTVPVASGPSATTYPTATQSSLPARSQTRGWVVPAPAITASPAGDIRGYLANKDGQSQTL